jgi:hypothetical protein
MESRYSPLDADNLPVEGQAGAVRELAYEVCCELSAEMYANHEQRTHTRMQ